MSLTAQAQLEDGAGNDLQATVQHSRIVWQAQAGDHLPELAALFYPGQPAIQAFWLKKVHEFNPNLPMDLPLLTAQELLIPDLAWLANQAIPKIPSTLKKPPDLTTHYDQLQRRNAELQRALAQTLQQQMQLERQLDELRQRLQQTAEAAPAAMGSGSDSNEAPIITVTPKPVQLPDAQKVRHYKVLDQTQSYSQAASLWQLFLRYWLLVLVLLIGLASIGGSIWLAASHKKQLALRQQAALITHAELTRPELTGNKLSAGLAAKTANTVSEVLTKSADLYQRGAANQALHILEDWVAQAPRQSVYPWLFLLAYNEAMQRMQKFSEVVEQMHRIFGLEHNVSSHLRGLHQKQILAISGQIEPEQVLQESLAHIRTELNQIWQGKDIGLELPVVLSDKHTASRTPKGFSVAVLREVTVLQNLLELHSS